MAKGNEIIVSANPRGVFLEGVVSGTPLPGTIMQIKAATAADAHTGRMTYEAYNRDADGDRPQGPIMVLLPDQLQGRLRSTAYADGERCFLYCPLPGEELNVLWSASGTGTGDSVAVGDLAIVNDGDGLLIDTTGSVESEPFVALEAVSDVTSAGTLVWSMFTGY